MLTNTLKTEARGAHELAISLLGTPVSVSPVSGAASYNAVVGFKTVGSSDVELINAYGVGAKIITISSKDVPAAPAKFDQVKVTGTGEVLTVSTVSDVHLNGELIAYKLATAGK